MEFKIFLPKISVGFKLAGVYRILFDDGSFYIGCSADLKSRSYGWSGIVKKPFGASAEATGALVVAKIRACGSASMDVVEVCAPDEVKDREAFYLNMHKNNPLMLSVAECQFKPVLQYNKRGTLIKRHISITAAAKYNNTTIGRIQDVLNGTRKSHHEMVFVYESDYEGRRKEITRDRYQLGLPKKNKNIKVVQYSGDGATLIGVHNSYAEAGRVVGCHPVNIKRVIAGRQQTAGSFKWGLSEV